MHIIASQGTPLEPVNAALGSSGKAIDTVSSTFPIKTTQPSRVLHWEYVYTSDFRFERIDKKTIALDCVPDSSGSEDKTVRIWDATGREGVDGCLRVFKGHSRDVNSVAILNDPSHQLSKSGLCIVSGSRDKTVTNL